MVSNYIIFGVGIFDMVDSTFCHFLHQKLF